MLVFAIIDLRSSPDHPLGDAVETFVRLEDAERFIAEVRGDDPELASHDLGQRTTFRRYPRCVTEKRNRMTELIEAGKKHGVEVTVTQRPKGSGEVVALPGIRRPQSPVAETADKARSE